MGDDDSLADNLQALAEQPTWVILLVVVLVLLGVAAVAWWMGWLTGIMPKVGSVIFDVASYL